MNRPSLRGARRGAADRPSSWGGRRRAAGSVASFGMAQPRSRLRLVGPDERATPPTEELGDGNRRRVARQRAWSRRMALPVSRRENRGSLPEGEGRRVVGALAVLLPVFAVLAVLVVGSAVALRLLLEPVGDRIARGAPVNPTGRSGWRCQRVSDVGRVVDPADDLVGDPPSAAVSPPAEGAPSLIAIPVAEGATAIAPTTAPAVTAPPVASARVLCVQRVRRRGRCVGCREWRAPVRYGTVQYGVSPSLALDGRWLPSGVDLELRFVPAGGDPTAESASRWSFTPPAGSSQTLVLSDNGGLRVLRVDNDRAVWATPEGKHTLCRRSSI